MPLCKFLEFDSELFGMRLGAIEGHTLTLSQVWEVRSWCALNRVKGMYFLADSSDAETAHTAQLNGFQFVDERVALERKLPFIPDVLPTVMIRRATSSDLDQLSSIAVKAHTASRFYFDPHFARSSCQELYDTWIRKSKETTVVAEVNGCVAGYAVCSNPAHTGKIELLAVDPQYQNRRVGESLVAVALEGFKTQLSVRDTASVVTQSRNIPALRLYQRCGFQITSVQTWYHLWL